MKKLCYSAVVVAGLALLAGGAVKLVATASPTQAADSITPLDVPTPPTCMGSRMQVPTSAGLEWKKLIVCPSD
jgi:hypothetical protein